jgi:hypothetical protein
MKTSRRVFINARTCLVQTQRDSGCANSSLSLIFSITFFIKKKRLSKNFNLLSREPMWSV